MEYVKQPLYNTSGEQLLPETTMDQVKESTNDGSQSLDQIITNISNDVEDLKTAVSDIQSSSVSITNIQNVVQEMQDKDYTEKTYVDNQDTTTLNDAKSYADTKDTETLNSSKSYTDSQVSTTLNDAKSYTDTQDATTLNDAKSYSDTQDATNLSNAKIYADNKITFGTEDLEAGVSQLPTGSLYAVYEP